LVREVLESKRHEWFERFPDTVEVMASGAWRVQYAEVERLTEGRDADHDLAVLQFSNSRAGQPNHMILKS
jgi:hypothetical protein